MSLDLRDCTFFGPALPEPYVKFHLEPELLRRGLLPKNSGDQGKALQQKWEVYRRKLRDLGEHGGDVRVRSHVLEPLLPHLGYATFERQPEVITREGAEEGGWLMRAADGKVLRCWSVGYGVDLDAPNRKGRAYRFSPSRVAQRVLQAKGERVGLVTDGQELRLMLCDPARPDSHIAVALCGGDSWRGSRSVPDSYRLLVALASPPGVAAIPELTDSARLAQATVTKKLRLQARRAVETFVQHLLEHPENQAAWAEFEDKSALAKQLWGEGLILVYRLLFVFKLESSADPARAFSFATQSLWRNTYSPNSALADLVRQVLDKGADSGHYLEQGLRCLWRIFCQGISTSELEIKPLGGMLFGPDATPLMDKVVWGELAVARLLDQLLWTPGEGKSERERVHYGALDVEDLGRVYEALLELEPGITQQPMCRLRRAKLEVVVPLQHGIPYRDGQAAGLAPERADASDLSGLSQVGDPPDDAEESPDDDSDAELEEDEDAAEDEAPKKGRGKEAKTKVLFIEEIPAHRFFLRVGLGRKATGSYYTPHPFVRFLVQETLGPQIAQRCPKEEPRPAEILKLKVLDPAMGSGHFLVEACRYLGDALYEACRLCDELALVAEQAAETEADASKKSTFLSRAQELRQRVADLPDPDDELVAYLPSRAVEGEQSGLSQKKAEALCRRLVAVHCLYGVDKNPLAVELAKLSLWLESYAEGLPLTFLDHRLIAGDSLTGPFVEHLATFPSNGKPMEMVAAGLKQRLSDTVKAALAHVADLEASVGKDVADLQLKQAAKQRLDDALAPLKQLARAWTGGVMLGKQSDDVGYKLLAEAVANGAEAASAVLPPAPARPSPDASTVLGAGREGGGPLSSLLATRPGLRHMLELGSDSVAHELTFPEVFFPDGADQRQGFHAVLGNPPWDAIKFNTKEFLAAFDLMVYEAPTKRERTLVEKRLCADVAVASLMNIYLEAFENIKRANDRLYQFQKVSVDGDLAGRQLDAFRVFMERNAQLLSPSGFTGVVVPSAFHANAGATGIRLLYLRHLRLMHCLCFENRNKLFEIHLSFKFAAVVATTGATGPAPVECGFYWHDLGMLFDGKERLQYTVDFIERTGGEYLAFLELKSSQDAGLARQMYSFSSFGAFVGERQLDLGAELHMTNDSHRFTPTADVLPHGEDPRDPEVAASLREQGYLPLHEGKTFHQYTDHWEARPRYLVALSALGDKSSWLQASQYYRLAFRDIASSTNERTGIFGLLPPGVLCGNKAPCERTPWLKPTASALVGLATSNSFGFDFALRLRVQATVNLFILNNCPLPHLSPLQEAFLSHCALRLSCNHQGYEALWLEQVGEEWREPTPRHTWPALEGDDARWAVRAAIDAVVAQAYGLNREQYAHVLSSFSHKSYPKAPERCLEAFDELGELGLEAFCRKHDPYWDIPLNMNLPKPVIDLPLPGGKDDSLLTGAAPAARKPRAKPAAPTDLGPLFRGK